MPYGKRKDGRKDVHYERGDVYKTKVSYDSLVYKQPFFYGLDCDVVIKLPQASELEREILKRLNWTRFVW